jgi:amino acid transporter
MSEPRRGARASSDAERSREPGPVSRDAPPREGVRERGGGPTTGEVRERQRDQYGGFKLGAIFFGWLVAVAIGVLLTAILGAAGAGLGLTQVNPAQVNPGQAQTVGIVSGIVLLIVFGLAYFAGGYVAGRLARFDGVRQGLGVWLFALLVAVLLTLVGAVLGAQYNVLDQLQVVPRIPTDLASLTTGGAIALVALLIVTVAAAILGGKAGEAFHRKVDRAGAIG